MPTLRQLIQTIDQFAPWELAESWDNSGLQVGSPESQIHKVMLAVDFNQQVFDEGMAHQVDGYIVHHPFLFKPVKRLNLATPFGKLAQSLIKHDKFLISAHTNVDKAAFGINHYLAQMLELQDIELLEPATVPSRKIVTFVPEDACQRLREAMANAGAGIIGDYSQCAFTVEGNGSFLPGQTAHPTIGTTGKLEIVSEIRLEMIVPLSRVSAVIKAIYTHHPYEEPAVDIYPIDQPTKHGLGRIGKLTNPQSLGLFCEKIKQLFQIDPLKITGDPERMIRTVAVCSGSGKSLIPQALAKHADVYVTADLTYHDHLDARENGLALVDVGHWTSEQVFVTVMADHLKKIFPPDALQIIKCTTIQEEPYRFI